VGSVLIGTAKFTLAVEYDLHHYRGTSRAQLFAATLTIRLYWDSKTLK
jgi:hypothetical protein